MFTSTKQCSTHVARRQVASEEVRRGERYTSSSGSSSWDDGEPQGAGPSASTSGRGTSSGGGSSGRRPPPAVPKKASGLPSAATLSRNRCGKRGGACCCWSSQKSGACHQLLGSVKSTACFAALRRAAKRALTELTTLNHLSTLNHMNSRIAGDRPRVAPPPPPRCPPDSRSSSRAPRAAAAAGPAPRPATGASPRSARPASASSSAGWPTPRPAAPHCRPPSPRAVQSLRAAILSKIAERRVYDRERLRRFLAAYSEINAGAPFSASLAEAVAQLEWELGLAEREQPLWA